jgi:hypothetical protein
MLAPFLVLTSVLRLTSGSGIPGRGREYIVGRKYVVGMVGNGRDGIEKAGMFGVEVMFVMVGMDGMG